MEYKKKDISGNKYGKLTAVKFVGINEKRSLWEFKCDCGNTVTKRKSRVTTGVTKSCGCIPKRGNGIDSGEYAAYKRNSKRRGYEFTITNDEFDLITFKKCHYCGQEPRPLMNRAKTKVFSYRNGIDRKNNNIGYVYYNCLPCCSECNFAKGSMDYEQFILWIKRIKNHII